MDLEKSASLSLEKISELQAKHFVRRVSMCSMNFIHFYYTKIHLIDLNKVKSVTALLLSAEFDAKKNITKRTPISIVYVRKVYTFCIH